MVDQAFCLTPCFTSMCHYCTGFSQPMLGVKFDYLRSTATVVSSFSSRSRIDDVHDYSRNQQYLHITERRYSQAGFRLAPPTKNPSMSDCFAKSLQFFSLTLPPYMIRVLSEASCETVDESHFLISACTSCACSVVATLPVPMALSMRRDNVSDDNPPDPRRDRDR